MSSKQSRRYTPEEDKLIVLYREGEQMTWRDISYRLPGRTPKGLSTRYERFLKNKKKKPTQK